MKKWLTYTGLALLAAAGAGGGYLWYTTAYQGTQQVILLNSGQRYESLQALLQQPAFQHKVVYVDVWGTTCGPCLEELRQSTPRLTQHYQATADMAFLYLCIDRHPLPETRWKSLLQQLQPTGYHALVEADEEAQLARDVLGAAVRNKYFPYQPFYLIVDKRGQVVGTPTANPDKGELRPSDGPRLYAKLDSVRAL